MRKITFGVANSLDNYIARTDNAVDWLLFGKEAGEVMQDYWKTIDTVLMGRRTFEAAVGSSSQGSGDNPYGEIRTYVFSRTMKSPPAGVELVSRDAIPFVAGLKRQPGKDICVMGGGHFAASLFAADLIDEVGMNIHPVLLGDGVPLFHQMPGQINLERTEIRACENGCVLVTYRVIH